MSLNSRVDARKPRAGADRPGGPASGAGVSGVDGAPGPPEPRAAGAGPALRVSGVHKRFPGVHALKGVSLEVRRGEVHAIVGENGAGKSTLMAVTAGVLAVDEGSVEIAGTPLRRPDPRLARDLGLAIVYQEPALVPDLTVAENVMLGLPPRMRGGIGDPVAFTGGILAEWRPRGLLDPRDHVRDLAPDARFIVEIARALAERPEVLVLDEPTEHLPADDVTRLFARIREVTARGGTVVYISHRIPEVRRIADRITVLRDGAVTGTFEAGGVDETAIVARIVGRALESRFPDKATAGELGATRLAVADLRGGRLAGVEFDVRAGEIVGLAGIDGQGQRDLLRAVAGLAPATGTVHIDGRPLALRSPTAARRAGVAYVPDDRHAEGLFPALSVRENVSVRALDRLARAGFVDPPRERRAVRRQRDSLAIRTADLETTVANLSGGNQQKTVLGRALLSRPAILLADEPTQGVDVGARADIYDILRSSARDGATVLVAGTDTAELVGLCDRVLVLSRGRVVAELSGDALTGQAVTRAVLTSTSTARPTGTPAESAPAGPPSGAAGAGAGAAAGAGRRAGLARVLASDRTPAGVLLLLNAVLAGWAAGTDPGYLSAANLTSVLTLFAALAFIALGQQLVMMTAGIDLSVGPLTGLLVVVASFVLADDRTGYGLFLGSLQVAAVVAVVGAANWALIWLLRINPMIATLVTFMAVQGVALLLRPEPGGTIAPVVATSAGTAIGPVPVAALAALGTGCVLELALRRAPWGWRLRAVGSAQGAARRSGVPAGRVLAGAYLGCALLTALGAVLLMAQVGSGDPNAGSSYTFASIAAVVLGGASIFGGRGSFLGALAGALLVIQINTVAVFAGLSDAWQLYLLGGLTLAAAAFYSRARSA